MDKIACERCSIKIVKTSNSQKYCKSCAYIVKLETGRVFQQKRRIKEEGTLGPHPIKNKNGIINFKAEHKAILKELKRLGLRK